MLKHLSITNYAIIESLELELSDGFTVITGETGAGKSILLGALALILGQRADTSVLNKKEKKCVVEGTFEVEEQRYKSFFESNDLDFDTTVIIRREINASGKSRAFINDTPVSLSILKEFTIQLIDIHSQHETLLLKSSEFQIKVLDAYGNIDVSEYKKEYVKLKAFQKELASLQTTASKAREDFDYLSFQVKEIEELGLKPNEKEEIEENLKLINNAEEIKTVLEQSSTVLSNSDQNIIQLLKEVDTDLKRIENFSPEYKLIAERFKSLFIELEDLSIDINRANDGFEFDSENLFYLNERINKIYTIEQKHNLNSTKEILNFYDKLTLKLGDVSSYDDKIEQQKKLVDKQKRLVMQIASSISEQRKKAISPMEKSTINNLEELGMPDSKFKIELTQLEEPNEKGVDAIEFLFSANKGFKPKQLGKIASGGELSRLMLIIKMFLSQNHKIATILFDEIDTGVSGDIADKMAEIMKKISLDTQVVAITHLPQVAAKGGDHFKISKERNGGITKTTVSLLEKKSRVEELAKMLSGKSISTAAIENAKVLLNK